MAELHNPSSESVSERVQSLAEALDLAVTVKHKEIAELEARNGAIKQILLSLPASLPALPENVTLSSNHHTEDAQVEFIVASREQGLELFNVLPGVPLLFQKGSISAYIPEERVATQHLNVPGLTVGVQPVAVPIGPVVYRMSQLFGVLQEELNWWTQLGSVLLKIRAVTKNPEAEVCVETFSAAAGQASVQWRYRGLPEGQITYWHGASAKQCAPITVNLNRDASVSEAYAKSMSGSYRFAGKL